MSLVARSKALSEFLPPSILYQGNAETRVTGISADSRQIRDGYLFVARRGLQESGIAYIKDAQQRGAQAVLTNDSALGREETDLPLAYTPDLDRQLSEIAGAFYDVPSARLSVTGVTGTNGKTSCCYWYAWLCNQLDQPCGQIGTLGAGYSAARYSAAGSLVAGNDGSIGSIDTSLKATGMTTPDAVRTQALLAEIKESGAVSAVMEVSSHGLDQCRVEAVRFESAIFTNLTQDHLDYHADMDAYFAAKALLFSRSELRRAVLNRDDHTFDRLSAALTADTELFSYSLSQPVADLFFSRFSWTDQGAEVVFDGRWGQARAVVPVVGEYNLSNLLAVTAGLLSAGFELSDIATLAESLPGVPGRMQLIAKPVTVKSARPRVVIDYAHTPDAVASALKAVRSQVDGKLICVVGCGGDRDRKKRPIMAQYAFENSDRCWFTSDNPRSENPGDILADMAKGLPDAGAKNVQFEQDRGSAIRDAINSAAANDLVMVLGKGHECFQEIAGSRLPFSDVDVAESVLNDQEKSGVEG